MRPAGADFIAVSSSCDILIQSAQRSSTVCESRGDSRQDHPGWLGVTIARWRDIMPESTDVYLIATQGDNREPHHHRASFRIIALSSNTGTYRPEKQVQRDQPRPLACRQEPPRNRGQADGHESANLKQRRSPFRIGARRSMDRHRFPPPFVRQQFRTVNWI